MALEHLLTRQAYYSMVSACFARRRAIHTSAASGVAYAENTRCNQSLKLDCKWTENQPRFQLFAFSGLLLNDLL